MKDDPKPNARGSPQTPQELARFPDENPNPVLRLDRDGILLYANAGSAPVLCDWGVAVGEPAPAFWRAQVRESLAADIPRTVDTKVDGRIFSFQIIPVVSRQYTDVFGTDITERTKKSVALTASEHRYRRLFETAKDGILILDAETGMVVDVNPFLIDMLGFSRETFLGKTIWDLGFFKDIVANRENFAELQQKEYIRYENKPLEAADGHRVEVEFVSNVYHVDNQHVIQCNIRDVTERHIHVREIERLNRLYSTLSQINESIVRVKSQAALFRDVCRVTAEVGGFKAVWIGRTDPETHHVMPVAQGGEDGGYIDMIRVVANDQPEGQGPVGTCIREGRPCVFNDFVNDLRAMPWRAAALAHNLRAVAALPIRFKGTVWGAFTVYDDKAGTFLDKEVALLEDAATNIAFAMETLETEAQRKAGVEGIQASEKEFRAMFEVASIGMAQADPHTGMWVRVNPKMCEITGYSPAELLQKRIAELTHPDDQKEDSELFNRVVRGELPNYHLEKRYLRKNGAVAWVNVNMTVVRDQTGQPVRTMATIEDITQRKQAELEHGKLQAQFAQAQKMESVGRLAGGVAHDFNNMLQVIVGTTDILMDITAPGDERVEDLKTIRMAAQRSADLTRQLLAFARKQTVAPIVLDLNETVESLLGMLRRLIGEQIDLRWTPAAHLAHVKIDPSQVNQILANLVVNARDAIGDTGILTIETGRARIDKEYCRDRIGAHPGHYILLKVTDNGCGMDKATMQHLFEPFFTTKELGKGTGLGLATVYGMVQQNKGFVNVYSEPSKGTTFTVYLPEYEEALSPTHARPERKETPTGTETVLLVEDEEAVRVLVRRYLKSLGYTVLDVGRPTEALQVAREHVGEIHLVVTDVVMPGMNGNNLAKELLEHRPTMKRLFVSGFTSDIIAQQGILAEGAKFLSKPFTRDQFARKVRQALDT